MRIKLKPKGITQVLVLPDIHFPEEDRRTMRAVEQLMRDEEWDHLIYLGDVMDFNCISEHNKHNLRAINGQFLAEDYAYANRELDKHASLVGPECSMTWIQGNHDERVERVINANPVMKGQLEIQKNIRVIQEGRLKFIRFWENGEKVHVGKAVFIHGNYVNEFHPKTSVLNYGTNIFAGHTHDVQNYPKVRDDDTIIGQSLGCLCKLNQKYMRGKPTRWLQAIGVFYFLPNGNFTYYVPMIFGHQFVWKGKVYKG